MFIKYVHIEGLNGGKVPTRADFHRDINILTGRNGAGKTTLLKSVWYAISGNLERLVREVIFDKFELATSNYLLTIERRLPTNPNDPREGTAYTLQLSDAKGDVVFARKTEQRDRVDRNVSGPISQISRYIIRSGGSSVFFPTFRRIEGGFGMGEDNRFLGSAHYAPTAQMQDALEAVSSWLSNGRHKFVASISTSDLKVLLNTKYAELSNRANDDSKRLLQEIFDLVRYNEQGVPRSETDALNASKKTLDDIRNAASNFERSRERVFAPFEVLLVLVHKILSHKGVRLTETLVAGDAAAAIDSTKLSAGEKQLLSFLCYNAFAADSVVFIDEPELSLHVDWQRVMVNTLTAQQPGNQFFIATHSPFIYSQYADKEVALSIDRGFTGGALGSTEVA